MTDTTVQVRPKEYSCIRCNEVGPVPSMFGPLPKYCASCKRAVQRESRKGWKTRNPAAHKAAQAKYYAANRDACAERIARWAAENPDRKAQHKADYTQRNPDRVAAGHRAYRERNRDKVARTKRRNHLRLYGITPEDYDLMLAAQGGVCAICFQACTSGKRLAVDHCHESGAVRGLLCGRCNMGIGKFMESATVLRAAADYLEEHKT